MSSEVRVRKDPPSLDANNQDIFIWALYLLGGADNDIGVEDVCLKCFEIAPARFSWRTHPELPDGVKGLKALSVAENKSHMGLILRPNKFNCRLTLEGVRWVEAYKAILENNYSTAIVQASKTTNLHERKRHELKKTDAWAKFLVDPALVEISDAAAALQCSAASPLSIWSGRVNDLRRTGDLLSDDSILNFADFVEAQFISGRKS